MKKIRYIIISMLAVFLLGILAGCGETAKEEKSDVSTSISSTTSTTDITDTQDTVEKDVQSTDTKETQSEVKEEENNLPTLRETDSDLSTAEQWDIVQFGTWWINDDNSQTPTEPITWYVVENDKENRVAWLFSEYILLYDSFSWEGDYCTWEDSYIRAYLNDPFYKIAFNEAEQEAIQVTTCECTDVYTYESNGSTEDKVFLLSSNEVYDDLTVKVNSEYGEYYAMNMMARTGILAPARMDEVLESGGALYAAYDYDEWGYPTLGSYCDINYADSEIFEYSHVYTTTYWYTRDVCEYFISGFANVEEGGTGIEFYDQCGVRPSIKVHY